MELILKRNTGSTHLISILLDGPATERMPIEVSPDIEHGFGIPEFLLCSPPPPVTDRPSRERVQIGSVPTERMPIGVSPDIEHGSGIPEFTLCSAPPPPPPLPLPPPPPPPPASDQPSREATEAGFGIYEVPHRPRKVKEIAYEPNVISIGPYHHGKKHLKRMEVIKQSCFNELLKLNNLKHREVMKAMEDLEERVRRCYGPIDHCEQFKEMMVYDGCFIVMLINDFYPDDLCKLGRHIQAHMWHDLLLLENQLPFFLLYELDCLLMRNGEEDIGRYHSLARLFQKRMHCSVNGSYTSPAKDIKHLLDLVHRCCRPSPQKTWQHQQFKGVERETDRSWKFIHSATELEDAGIDFSHHDKDKEQGIKSLFDITFTRDTKVLKIPTLLVDDNTERLLRNFMAYEQFNQTGEPTYVSDYVVFMDNLINTGKDVKLLCRYGIIDNRLGDEKVVALMFNKLCDSIRFSDDFLLFSNFYADTFDKVNIICKRKWNMKKAKRKWEKYRAILKKDYFNSPWSLCSFVAAAFLLLFTLLQTMYTVLSYFRQ
ncbi:hypothetical protein GQ457_12G004840 [Hibiscus cannabinus]